jgi:hypothetical protein
MCALIWISSGQFAAVPPTWEGLIRVNAAGARLRMLRPNANENRSPILPINADLLPLDMRHTPAAVAGAYLPSARPARPAAPVGTDSGPGRGRRDRLMRSARFVALLR